ncbi:methyl-accepting chemotaxis protein [Butyrivibrio sp. YAB3001]|uniref:methyl-accepting chemotaxis protein n=1 Tax=Butyrivibrio sp. YAB3001 TaxID=1520812 RepID=UPI0008F61DBA|nr:methyl-accepting chemotaxis protein [Butyrivibrio sp. YAB3001]SFD06504.1 methyl-accepting chemotaxis protein [Butyrivibrio sp. YAB3001]
MSKRNVTNDKKLSFAKSSVKTKLIIIMLLIAIIPLGVAIQISYSNSASKAEEDAKSSLIWESKTLEAEVNTIFLQNKTALTSLASAPSTVAFLKGVGNISASQMKEQMEKIDENFQDSNSIVISDTEGNMLVRSDDKELMNISEREYFQTALSGQINVSGILQFAGSDARGICIAVPVYDDADGKVIGVIHRNFDLNNFHKILAANDLEAFLVDTTGTLAAHSEYEISASDEPTDLSGSPFETSEEISGVYSAEHNGENLYIGYTKEPFSGYTLCVARNVDEVVQEARNSALTIVGVGLFMVIIVLIISVIMANSFIKPILEVNKLLAALANGEFVRISKYLGRTDEFGQMIEHSNTVVEKLETIVGHIKESSNTVNGSSEELSVMANQIAATTENVADAVQDIAAGASEQAKDVQESAESAGMISQAMVNVQDSTNNLNGLANRMKNASETSSSSLTDFRKSSEKVAGMIVDISDKISATQNAVAAINEKVEGISGIAAQTNLLSLNASIEAARAGDAGMGFAVVAEEIRKLADDSESLAKEIQVVMESLLTESASAVQAANLIIEDNKKQQEALEYTIDSVNGMIIDIEKTVDRVEKISGETDICVSSTMNVSKAMSSLSAISEENAAATETTGASVEELSATVSSLADSASNLKVIADRLNGDISFFKLNEEIGAAG